MKVHNFRLNADGSEKAKWAGVSRYANAGLAQRIRDMLADHQTHTLTELATRLKVDRMAVLVSVTTLCSQTGGAVCLDPNKRGQAERRYAAYDSPIAQMMRQAQQDLERPYAMAGKITHGRGSKWGAGY